MKIMMVLSHLMSKEAKLSDISISRINLATKLFKEKNCKLLVTSGWAYRADCLKPISDVFKNYILHNYNIDSDSIISIPYSRDTVGDAIFFRKFLYHYTNELNVVTSEYHVKRTKLIFKSILPDIAKINFFGSDEINFTNKSTLLHENDSISAFKKTFKNTNFNCFESILFALSKSHPLYNGKVFSKIDFNSIDSINLLNYRN